MGDPVIRLRCTLAWDHMHEYVLGGRRVHARRDYGSFLCGYEASEREILDTTPWPGEGPWCRACFREIPDWVRWVEPEPRPPRYEDVREMCEMLGVGLRSVGELPDEAEAAARPCGAAVERFDPPSICTTGGLDGRELEHVHRVGILHELTHLVCSPYAWRSEAASGFYAVQYALALTLRESRQLRRSTLDVQGTGCPVFGGILQARAHALGLLDETRHVPELRPLGRVTRDLSPA